MKNNYNEGNTACAIHWPCFSSIHKILTPKLSWFCDKPTQCKKEHTERTSASDREEINLCYSKLSQNLKELRIKRKSNIKPDSHNQTISCNQEKTILQTEGENL